MDGAGELSYYVCHNFTPVSYVFQDNARMSVYRAASSRTQHTSVSKHYARNKQVVPTLSYRVQVYQHPSYTGVTCPQPVDWPASPDLHPTRCSFLHNLVHLDPQSVLQMEDRPSCHVSTQHQITHNAEKPSEQARTFAYAVRWLRIHTLSHPSTAYGLRSTPGGGSDSGCTSCRSRIPAPNRCKSRTSMNEISLYANCCPRQMRGPPLNGRKMNGFGTRYFCTRASRNRSGSNVSAVGGYAM